MNCNNYMFYFHKSVSFRNSVNSRTFFFEHSVITYFFFLNDNLALMQNLYEDKFNFIQTNPVNKNKSLQG